MSPMGKTKHTISKLKVRGQCKRIPERMEQFGVGGVGSSGAGGPRTRAGASDYLITLTA